MKKHTVLLTDPIAQAPRERLEAQARVVLAPDTRPETLIDAARDAAVIVVRSPLPPALFDHAPLLRGAVRHGAGIDMIPVEAASRHGVAVANVPGANAVTVAEYVLGQMLNLAHRLTEADGSLRRRGWAETRAMTAGKIELSGRRLGIIGAGQIALALANMAHFGLGMRVSAHRPSMKPVADFIEMQSVETVFSEADFVVLACPLNDATRGMVNAELIARMKPDAVLINVARGAVVDEAALVAALAGKRIRGAALDVYGTQPLPADSPLLELDNVVLTSHMAGITRESMLRMSETTVDQVLQLLRGELPEFLCNADARDAIGARWRRQQAAE